MGLDLGNIINTGLGVYRDIKVADTAQPAYYQPAFQPGALSPFSDVPFTDLFTDPSTGAVTSIPKGYRLCNGKLTKIRRRRRKRLATASDIKDLASLSAVTTGPEKKTWIATHPS